MVERDNELRALHLRERGVRLHETALLEGAPRLPDPCYEMKERHPQAPSDLGQVVKRLLHARVIPCFIQIDGLEDVTPAGLIQVASLLSQALGLVRLSDAPVE